MARPVYGLPDETSGVASIKIILGGIMLISDYLRAVSELTPEELSEILLKIETLTKG